jgi:hypothetical protein
MGKKKDKEKKSGISRRTITIACATFACALVIGALTLFIKFDGAKLFTASQLNSAEIIEKAEEAVESCDYALLTLSIEDTVAGEGSDVYNYVYTCGRNTTESSYVYSDSDGTELYEYWEENEENGNYDVYVYDTDYEVWVKTSYDTVPVTDNVWDILSNINDYTLADETECWYGTDTECYVYEILGSSDDYESMYEQLFIRTSDYMPMGIVSYAVSDVNYDKVANGEDIEIFYDTSDDAEIEVPTYNENVTIYEVTFSTSELKWFDKPDSYLSEEEYMTLLSTVEEETEDED